MKNLINKYILNFGCDWSNKSDVISKVKKNGLNLQYADYGLRDDFDVVEEAITENPDALEYASRQLRNDKKIALIAIGNGNGSNKFISEELKNNHEFAKNVWDSTKNLSVNIFGQPVNILPALYSDGSVWIELAKHPYASITQRHFKNMSDELKSNKSFMLKLIKEISQCFELASDELRDDEELAQLAIEEWCFNLQYTSQRIKDSKKFQDLFLNAAWEMDVISFGGKEKIKNVSDEVVANMILENKKQLERIILGKDLFNNNEYRFGGSFISD